MLTWFTFAIACLALCVSAITAWLTFFHKGRLVMTQPTTVYFGPDGPSFDGRNKVYLRTLLYSTAKRGYALESLYLSLQRNGTKQNFNVWVCGEKGALDRGSGLFVPQEGVTLAHHFLLPDDGAIFSFLAGAYTLSVYAKGGGEHKPTELMTIRLSLSESTAKELLAPNTGLYFDWSHDQQTYHPHVRTMARKEANLKNLLQFIEQENTAD
ncbi:hypothetical protein ACO0LM_00685 [Undibacterium sp. Di26W]|uniref:hypothetical protein n=1 Tax=Undibacterium sp. Di26W TaxID=3413035 RepID=UPI003BF3F0DC